MSDLEVKTNEIIESSTATLIEDRGYYKMASLLSRSPLVPKSISDPGSIFLVIKTAQSYGIDYLLALQNAYLINGKLTFSSHFLWARAIQHTECVYHSISSNESEATAVIKRRMKSGEVVQFKKTFSLDDAKKVGLASKDIWRQYPVQMLEARAKSFCVRNAFPDFMSGIYSKEELETDKSKIEAEPESKENKGA